MQEYLTDKLEDAYRSEIPKVMLFSQKVALNYDCLRAIAFELNLGLPFEQAIQDLNIINMGNEEYDIILHYCNGMTLGACNVRLDLFTTEHPTYVWLDDNEDRSIVCAEFDPSTIIYDKSHQISLIPAEKVKLSYNEHVNDSIVNQFKKMMPDYLSITRTGESELHYWIGSADTKHPICNRRAFHRGNTELPF